MQITSVRSLITIFVTETLMKEYDMDRDLWLIAYFRCRQIDRICVVPYVFPSIHIYFFWKKDSQGGSQVGSQGGSLSARSFDLARPGLAPPLHKLIVLKSLSVWYHPFVFSLVFFVLLASSVHALLFMNLISSKYLFSDIKEGSVPQNEKFNCRAG